MKNGIINEEEAENIAGIRGRTVSFDIKTGLIEVRISGKKTEVI